MRDPHGLLHARWSELDEHRPWAAAATLAGRQHGVVSRAQLRAAGLSDRQIDHARQRGLLHRVHRGVFAFGSPRLGGAGRWWAGLLACGPSAVLGYQSAGAAWNLRPTSGPTTHVVVPSTSRPTHDGVRVRCHPGLRADEVTVHDGFPVTTVARTLLDLAVAVSEHELRRAVSQAEILHRFDLQAVEAVIYRHQNHLGRRRLESVLANWSTPALVRSNLEMAFVHLCVGNRLPPPLMNGEVLGMEVDATFPDHAVAVELDGGRVHAGSIQRENDYAKRAALTAAGWSVLAYTYRQVTDDAGAAVLRTLLPVLAQRNPVPRGPSGR